MNSAAGAISARARRRRAAAAPARRRKRGTGRVTSRTSSRPWVTDGVLMPQEPRGSARSLGQQRVGFLFGDAQLLLDLRVGQRSAAGLLEDVGEARLVGLLDRPPLRDRGVRAALLDRLEEAAVVGVGLPGGVLRLDPRGEHPLLGRIV